MGDTTANFTAQIGGESAPSGSGSSEQSVVKGNSGATITEGESASTSSAPQASVVSPADQELLMYYFGLALKDQIVKFYEKILLKPDAKPASFGHLLSNPIADKTVRAQLHQDVRRIFDSHLETQMMSDGGIKITAASRAAKRHNGMQAKQNHRGQGDINQLRGKVGWDEKGGQYLHFSLYKENKDTMEVLSFISQRLHVKPKDFAFAGTKDRRAATVQRVSVLRQHANKLASLNSDLRNARVGDFKHEKHKLELGELNGNEFVITLRDCHFGDDIGLDDELRLKHANLIISQAAKHLQEHGFINYYGLQRFGTFGTRTDEVGLKILQGDFKGAVDGILAVSDEALKCALDASRDPTEFMISRDDIGRALGIHLFRTTGKSSPALEKLPRKFSGESAIIRHLGNPRTWNDYLGALTMISRNLKTMYVHAYQSLVWNMVASQRWERYGNKVIEGDLILVDTKAIKEALKDEIDENGEIVVHPTGDDVAVTHDDLYQRARPLTLQEAQSGEYTIFDIVLPTPGYDVEYPRNVIGDYYKEFMASERGGGLDPADMRRNQKDFSLSGSYRKLMAKVGKDFTFEVKTYLDELEQLVETDLEKLDKAKLKAKNDADGHDTNRSGGASGNRGRGNWANQYQYRGNARQDAETVRACYAGTAQLNAWANLPAKLAADDKVAAAVADQEKEARMSIDPSTIKQPVIKDTWIQTDAENQGRRTGHKSTVIIPGVGDSADDGSKDSTTAASSDNAVMDLDVPKTSAVGAPSYDAVINLDGRKTSLAEYGEVIAPAPDQLATKPSAICSTDADTKQPSSTEPADVIKSASGDVSMETEDESDGGVKLEASPQMPAKKDLGEQILKASAQMPAKKDLGE